MNSGGEVQKSVSEQAFYGILTTVLMFENRWLLQRPGGGQEQPEGGLGQAAWGGGTEQPKMSWTGIGYLGLVGILGTQPCIRAHLQEAQPEGSSACPGDPQGEACHQRAQAG